MWLSISLFPDLDGLDGLIDQSEWVLQTWLWAMAFLLIFIVSRECALRFKRRSEVEKIIRRRLG